MANIKNHLNNIKNALFGQEVRGSIHDGIDAINKEVESTTGRQVDLEKTFDQLVINAGNSNAEIVDARVKSDGTSYSKLGDRLNEVDSQLEQIENKIEISVTDFGAKGDGVTDDTMAFKLANQYAFSLANKIPTHQQVGDCGITIKIPNGTYIVKGDKILGSVRKYNEYPNIKPIRYEVKSDNATIMWHVEDECDKLFYFDYTINRPTVTNLLIFTPNENHNVRCSGTIFHFEGVKNDNGDWLSDASNGYFANIETVSGRNNASFSNKVKYVFNIQGENLCDQALVINCRFTYYETLFNCENSQSVNWNFLRCSFFSPYADTVYFKFTKMNDNFNVSNCSFSLADGQTLVYCDSSIGNDGILTQRPDYNFVFDNNRFEVYSLNNKDYIDMVKANFGVFSFRNSNLLIGSGCYTTKQRFLLSSHASLRVDNCVFNNPVFTIPVIEANAIGHADLDFRGLIIKDCVYQGNYDLKTYKWSSNTITNLTLSYLNDYLKSAYFENLRKYNSAYCETFSIVKPSNLTSAVNRYENTFTYAKGGSGTNVDIKIPPYNAITKIELVGLRTIPNDYSKFKVYFGNKSDNVSIICDNISPDSIPKMRLTIFDGLASIFKEDLNEQTIYVTCVKTDGSEAVVSCEVKITCTPLNTEIQRITKEGVYMMENKAYTDGLGGATSKRPASPNKYQIFFDLSLNKPIWYNGAGWLTFDGNPV